MAFEITPYDDYVRIDFLDGLDYWEILEAIGKLISLPIAAHKNDLWVFTEDQLNFTYNDLYKISEVIKTNYPSDATGTKSAIVVSNGVQKGLAELYREIAKDFPREIVVFTNLAEAEDWIKYDNIVGKADNKTH